MHPCRTRIIVQAPFRLFRRMTRILHTADWHLGARLVEQERTEEHGLFLQWLLQELRDQPPDLLVIAGDIFDSANPPQQALRQYYDFLAQVSLTTSIRVLVLGGNHDSAVTLHAPRELLKSLRIDVVGLIPEEPEKAIFELDQAVICAVPFLRERDVRRAAPGQSTEEIAAQMREGIASHYSRLLESAAARAAGRAILATGHLTAADGERSDSERKIHIGGLGAVGVQCFDGFDYVALGHLHRPQKVGGRDEVRYSGSPIPLSFDEIAVGKQVLRIEIDGKNPVRITSVPVPRFRPMHRCLCTLDDMGEKLRALAMPDTGLRGWVDLIVTHELMVPDLERRVREIVQGLPLTVLKKKVTGSKAEKTPELFGGRGLHEVEREEIFEERLRRKGIDPDSETGRRLRGTFVDLLGRMLDASVAGEKTFAGGTV